MGLPIQVSSLTFMERVPQACRIQGSLLIINGRVPLAYRSKVHYKHVWKGAISLPIQGFNNQQYNHLYKKMMHKPYQFKVYFILKNPSYSIINIHECHQHIYGISIHLITQALKHRFINSPQLDILSNTLKACNGIKEHGKQGSNYAAKPVNNLQQHLYIHNMITLSSLNSHSYNVMITLQFLILCL